MSSKNVAPKEQNKELESLLADAQIPIIHKSGDVIEGTVLESNESFMIVDVGARSEGIIAGRELKLNGEKITKKVGEQLLVYVVTPENEEGQIELSIRQTGDELRWHELEESKENETPIKVKVIEANTGGVIVEIGGGLRGFVPSSQLKNSRIFANMDYSDKSDAAKQVQSRLAQMIDEELEVVVMEINRNQNRVILSEKHVEEDVDLEQRQETLQSLKVGDSLTGKVTGIAPFGLFVSAEGLEGLVHLSEISWDKVENPADFYKVGEEVDVQVIGLNDGGKRIAYSIKRLKQDPWKNIVKKYQVGQTVDGVVSSVASYGAFVKVEDGLNGLIHISELSHKLVKDPSDIVKVGEAVKVMIISISNDDRHLGLSIKRLQPAPKKSAKKADESASEESSEVSKSEDSARELEGLDKLIEGASEEKE